MQTQTQIRQMLDSAGLAAQQRFGQCFLVDLNLMGKLLALADIKAGQTILEVGPGTGSLTEELLDRAGRVVAVEIDHGLARLLRDSLSGRTNLALIEGDAMAGKHRISPGVLAELGPRACLVANLPYNIATPLIAECLVSSWRASAGRNATDPAGGGCAANTRDEKVCLFESLTFTVQREVADRLTARPGQGAYGPVSILASLMGKIIPGPAVPPEAFWPAPKVSSRIMRIEFDHQAAARVADLDSLMNLLNPAFSQRRKQIGSLARRKTGGETAGQFSLALEKAGVDPSCRPDAISPGQYLRMAGCLPGDRNLS
ncbi:MAG: 16S rRNA (adenine(1518)-N(6)/adenine(1519)-N(6))-dimethyltransferase [Planctomycetes bacterium]|nr:16S rRNA (adenine(1518)-N(6)/adenine(1519)-N(6))-dimethyltransferase [Planctomycetota bacterium]